MTVTLQQVAERAGVSRSTASRALSGSPSISAATRTTVEAVALSLGYTPNRAASALRSQRSHLLGLVMNNLVNASFHTIAEVVLRRAAAEGYQVLMGVTDADSRRERELLGTLAAQQVDGVIVIGTGQNTQLTNRMRAAGTAVVDLIRSAPDSAAAAVLAADREGAAEAVGHLLRLGHRRIGYIGGPAGTNSGEERYAGYADALAAVGVPVDPALVVRGPFTPDFGVGAIERLFLGAVPLTAMTALFVANHEASFGALPVLAGRGLRVPDDLSLICHEDVQWFRWWNPPVTVVDNGARELGELAMDVLLGQLGPAGAPARGERGRTYRVGAQLVERASCRAVGRPT